ncbi:site-2 protease family protein [Chloroflexota bacterium]
MLLWNFDLLINNPAAFFLLVATISIALLVALTVHEFSHGLISHRLGDPTAKRLGRLSLNPIKHLDPMGTLMIFLVGFGWGKPVPVNPAFFRGNIRSGMGLVALGGPLSNFLVAAIFGGLLVRTGLLDWHSPWQYQPFSSWGASSVAADIVGYIILLNLVLGTFNLIPIAPLDGFRIAVGILPRAQAYALAKTERYGPMILLVFILLGYTTGFLWDVLIRAIDLFARLFVGKGF